VGYAVTGEDLDFIDNGLTNLLQNATIKLKGDNPENDETYTIEKQYIERLWGYYDNKKELRPSDLNEVKIDFSTYKTNVDNTITNLTNEILRCCDPESLFMKELFTSYPNIKAYVE
jgi:hypothetical protein